MDKLNDAFLSLVKAVNDDPLKVFDDALTYILRFLSIDKEEVSWSHTEQHNQAFADFLYAYLDQLKDILRTRFWYDAWGDIFMDLAGKFKSFRGQFFTPDSVADLCAKMCAGESFSRKPLMNDCACCSARMLLAAYQVAYEKMNIKPYLIGEDIDGMCCRMAAINLAVHGCCGEVIRHDSLKCPDDMSYGYIVNESLEQTGVPSIRKSYEKSDFVKFRI